MRLEEVLDKHQYEALLASHPQSNLLQSWDWGEWKHSIDGQTPRRFFVISDSGDTLLSIQCLEIRVPLFGTYQYVAYGPLFYTATGVDKIFQFFTQELFARLPQTMALCVEPINELRSGIKNSRSFPRKQPQVTRILNLQKPMDQLLKEMHPKTRYNIRLSSKHLCTTHVAQSNADVTHGIKLITDTQNRQGFRGRDEQYYEKLLRKVPGSLMYVTLCDGEVTASGIFVDYRGTRIYMFGGSSQNQREKKPPYHLHYQSIFDAQSKGITAYDLWGTETSKGEVKGFARFKEGFAGYELHYPQSFAIINKPVHYNLFRLTNRIRKTLHL